jgi:selenocysteine-specific elongation factor
LAPADTFHASKRVDVSLALLRSAKPLKDRARVHLHAYTSETVAEVRIYGKKQIAPGEEAYAQLRMDHSALLLPGDRFIIRQFSPVVTIGGGSVLDVMSGLKSKKREIEGFLKVLSNGESETTLKLRIAQKLANGFAVSDLVAQTGWTKAKIEQALAKEIAGGRILRLGDRLVHQPAVEALKLFIGSTVEDFHRLNPLVPGMSRQELHRAMGNAGAPAEVFACALDGLVKQKKLEVTGEIVRLAGRGVVMKDEEAESKKIIEHAFSSAGLTVPALHQVLGGLKIDKARAQKIMTLLLREKILIKISDELVFHRDALDQLRRQLAGYKTKFSTIDVGKFKELTGVSRKYAIPLLEYLDRERVTRRVGDERVIL